ncbi:hypothetical protein [Burkholderia anthina]|uniref:hypothetical protein n=1 Tax=Burkholderia anthina TaxID=179879 RepID=UPI00158DE2B6|nr:hypothetical protein [Burkholderia anthina]
MLRVHIADIAGTLSRMPLDRMGERVDAALVNTGALFAQFDTELAPQARDALGAARSRNSRERRARCVRWPAIWSNIRSGCCAAARTIRRRPTRRVQTAAALDCAARCARIFATNARTGCQISRAAVCWCRTARTIHRAIP